MVRPSCPVGGLVTCDDLHSRGSGSGMVKEEANLAHR